MVSMVIPAFQIGGTMDLVLSTVALIAISVLVAWETQAMKAMYYGAVGNPSLVKKLALFGATSLLLSFYNMFQFLLNIMGSFGE
jgi:FtsH-binding integral membrane protein